MADTPQLEPKAVEAQVRRLLGSSLDDEAMLAAFEEVARQRAFSGFTWLWGPPLYHRSRARFRAFLRSHFGHYVIDPKWRVTVVEWKGEPARALDPWLAKVDRDDDVDLFRRLYAWKNGRGGKAEQRWRDDLAARIQEANSPSKRQTVLAKFDIGYPLDEAAACGLYRVEPALSPPFLLRHLPYSWTGKRTLWEGLAKLALERGNEEFHFALYRRQVDLARWQAEALALCDRIREPERLNPELDRRHPEGWGLDLGGCFFALAEKRGRDVFPYLFRRLSDARNPWALRLWFKDGADKLLDLARRRGWLDLWAGLLRACGTPKQFNQEILSLLADRALGADEVARRLRLLAGASREWNFPGLGIAAVSPLEDRTALTLHERFPELVRGPFRLHVTPGGRNPYAALTERAISTGDEDLVDWLASRLATAAGGFWTDPKVVENAERVARRFEEMRALDPQGFARRAARILGLIPAYAIFRYDPLLKANRLARLLFERSASSYLADPASLRELIEGSEIHVMALAYRALGLDDDRARKAAAENLDLLLGTLLRPLHRRTRALAFRALANAAHDPEAGARVLKKAREALDLPDKKYPKEALAGLIGRVLRLRPELRGPREQPRLFARAAP